MSSAKISAIFSGEGVLVSGGPRYPSVMIASSAFGMSSFSKSCASFSNVL